MTKTLEMLHDFVWGAPALVLTIGSNSFALVGPELSGKAHDALPHVLIGAAASVADNAQNIAAAGYLVDHLLILIHYTDVMSFFTELSGKRRSHFAAADYNNFHKSSSMPHADAAVRSPEDTF